MSDDKNKVTDKAGEIAKNIWLAGIGAYGKAVEEAQGRLEKAMEPPKLFRELVKAGTALEEEARETTATARHSVEERIGRVRDNFQMQRPARNEDLAVLQKKVDQLSRKVDRLSKALAEAGVGKSASAPNPARKKKTAPRKPISKKASAAKKKPAIKKAPNRKKSAPGNRKA
ncbi:MAG: phasin family protein [Halioglobus sp.]|nr:phasin family protein [Halioglobus sp.]